MKKTTNDDIAVRPWKTKDSLKCVARRKKQKISNNKLLDEEESKIDKSEHQTSVLGLISNTTINECRPKKTTLKNKKNLQERIDESNIHLTRLFLGGKYYL